MEAALSTNIKGYEVQERIGAGGFGAVYRAYQTTVGREVVIKCILPSLANRPEFIRRFETEAQIIARLEHLHIVPLYDYWRDPDGAYLVMRYLRGGSLRDALAKGAYDLEAAANLLDQISSGLAAAHRSSVIHRDLKPGNILLDEDGNAYLADFGIAKNLAIVDGSITEPDRLVGSPDYLAPEQARTEPVTPQTDIYSLGVVLYELLTGEHPYPGLSPVERMFKHLNDPIPPIRSLDSGVADAVNAVVQRATAKNPAHRYADILEMAAAFREAAALNVTRAGDRLVELLTPREQEILQRMIQGKSNREIAQALVIELSTVKWYINQIYHKLNVRSRVQAIVRARELNLIVDGRPTEVADSGMTFAMAVAPKNPYKGLCAFQAADEQDFFGREKLVRKLLKRLEEKEAGSRFLAAVGPSGSGKSSVVKAGLIPALWRGELPGSEKWFIAEMIPGAHPLDELEVSLMRLAANPTANLREQLERDARGLTRTAQILLPDDGSDLLLVIDQFEEVFTLVEAEAERQHFLDMLHTAVTDPRSRVRVIVTLRADFYDRPLHYPKFGDMLRSRMETVLPLSAEELERAISQPAEHVGVNFEEGLIPAIIADVHYQPGGLPLLQYALTELFESRDGRLLTHEAYQRIGRAVGALAKRAEDFYAELSGVGQAAVRQMFLRLVTPGEGTEDARRRVPRSELLSMTDAPEIMDEVIDTFAAYRLLSLDRDAASREPTVEVAHEALLREWERLRSWLNESRADIRLQRQLASAAVDWQGAGRESSFLLRGARLEQFEGWSKATALALTPAERDYLEASLTQRDKEQKTETERQSREVRLQLRARRVLQGLVGMFFIAALISGGLALWANSQRILAQINEHEARRQGGIGLGAQAQLEVVAGDPARAVLVALEAVKDYPYTWQAERALRQSVSQHQILHILEGHTDDIHDVIVSPDGTRFLTASSDGSARVWDMETGEQLLVAQHPLADPENPASNSLSMAVWSPDGRRFVTSNTGGDAIVWDAQTGEQLAKFTGHNGPLWQAAWSPDGTWIITGSGDKTARIWDAKTGKELHLLQGQSRLPSVTVSPDGAQVAASGWGGPTVHVWDAKTGALVWENKTRTGGVAGSISWSPDGRRLVGIGAQISIWDASTGDLLHEITAHAPYKGDLTGVWSPDGTQFATGNFDNTASIWNVETGEEVLLLPSQGLLFDMAWSHSGRYIAGVGNDQKVTIWDATTGLFLRAYAGHDVRTVGIAWSLDDKRLISVSPDKTVRIWLSDPRLEATRIPTPNLIWQTAWSPDGARIAGSAVDHGSPLIWDATTGKTLLSLDGQEGEVLWVSWSPDGSRLATASRGDPANGVAGTARIWDSTTGKVLLTLSGYQQFYQIDWSPDSRQIVTTVGKAPVVGKEYWATAAVVWNTATGEQLTVFEPEDSYNSSGIDEGIAVVAWSPDGKRIVTGYNTGGYKGFAWVWNAETGEALHKLEVGAAVETLDWSASGDRILSVQLYASELGGDRIKFWDADTGEMVNSFEPSTGNIWAASWSKDRKQIALIIGSPVRLAIYDVETGGELARYNNYRVGGWGLDWSPDGQYVVVGGSVDVMSGARLEPPSVVIIKTLPSLDALVNYATACCTSQTTLTPQQRDLYGLPPRAVQPSSEPPQSRGPALPFAISLMTGVLAGIGVWRLRKPR